MPVPYKDLAESKMLAETLNEIDNTLYSAQDYGSIMDKMLRLSTDAIGAESGVIFSREGDRWLVCYEYKLPVSLAGQSFSNTEVIHTAITAETKRSLIVQNASNSPDVDRKFVEMLGIRSLLDFPLIVKGEVIGDLTFHYHSSPIQFNERQVEFVRKLQISISLALENIRLIDTFKQNEAKLKEAERLGRFGYFHYTVHARKTIWSEGVFNIFGRDPALGEPTVEEFLELYSVDPGPEKMRELLGNKESCEFDAKIKRGDLNYCFHFSIHSVKDEKGDVETYFGTIQDITERKRDEEALQASESRFHAIFNLAAVGIAQVSLAGQWLMMNQKLSAILGYSFDELKNMTLLQISYPEDIEPHLAHIRRLLAGEVSAYTMEKRYICKDGSIVWVNLDVTLVRDKDEVPEYFIAVVEDINERKRAEEALRESEERFRLLADTAPVMIWESGPDASCTFFNKPWLEFTGRSLEQEIGDGWKQGVHPDDRERCCKTYMSAFRDRLSFSMEYRLREGNGEYAWVADTGVPRLAPNGILLGYIGTCFDITERKRAKETLQEGKDLLERRVAERTAELDETIEAFKDEIDERISMAQVLRDETTERVKAQEELRETELLLFNQGRLAAMGEMVGNIAHQWRQPLNILGLYSQDILMTYKKGKFNTEYLEAMVKKMLETIQHMSKTIDDFRNFFRPDKEWVEFRVLEVVEKTISLLGNCFKAQQIGITVIPVGDPVVGGCPNQFCQVLFNIMNNARDAFITKRVSSPMITIDIGMEEGRCVVTITDNAGGIPEDIIPKIFDPYFTTKGPDKGTGVGLYMSKMIIEKNMGGILSARNVGGGAQFRIVV